MKTSRTLLLLFIFFLLLYILFTYYFMTNIECFSNELTFSNTDKWGLDEKDSLNRITPLGKKLVTYIPNLPFPQNLSTEAKVELENIKKKQFRLTKDRQQDIESEILLRGTFQKFDLKPPESNQIVHIFQSEIDPIIMYLKNKYNRVRPYKLDKTIVPSIDPPQHPSYPSGHATQVYFIANVLSEKYPSKHSHFMHIADTIAVNREYAGVHYESDTKFGKIVADSLFQHFSRDKNPLT